MLLQILRENMVLAIDFVLDNHDDPQILIILGAMLKHIQSEPVTPHLDRYVLTPSYASSAHTCSVCDASHMESYYTSPNSSAIECPSCHRLRAAQRSSMRVHGILGAYALRLLRGEVGPHAEQCKSLLRVFEIVYSRGQFSLSKVAMLCISNVVHQFCAAPSQHDRFCSIKIPRWAAHALFPEYSCVLQLQADDTFAAPCAAALGWWIDDSGTRHSVHDHVKSLFSVQEKFMNTESRLPFGMAFSHVCITLLSMMKNEGSVDESHAVATLLHEGVRPLICFALFFV
jgi:hypothetical protein